MNKNLEILEFHKILDMLANLSANDITREKVLAITPNPDLAEARAELEKTNDAFQLSIQFGAPPFHRFQDMRMGLRRGWHPSKGTRATPANREQPAKRASPAISATSVNSLY